MEETLTLHDGTVLEDSHVMELNGTLSFYVRNGMTMTEVFALFNDPEKTDVIVAHRYGADHTYEGYTDLNFIQKRSAQVSGGLRKPERSE